MRKKILMCLFFIIVVIIVVSIIGYNSSKKKYQYSVEKLTVINYFLFQENNKYGVIDKSGNVLIAAKYDVIEIPNPAKDVFVCKNNYDASKSEYNIQVFDKNANPILYQYYIVEAIELNNVENNGNYEKSVLRYKSNGLYGLIDFSGKKVTDAVYESIEGFECSEGLMLVKKAGKLGIINMNGAVVVKPKYDEIYSDKYYDDASGYQKSGYVVGKKSSDGMRYGFISSDRKEILKNEFNAIYRIEGKADDVYLIAFKDGKAGVYKNKKNIIKHEYEDIEHNAKNDLLMVQKASKQGVAKMDGTIIVPIEYNNILFAGSYINAKKDENIDIYDNQGHKEQNENLISKQDFCDGKYAIVSTTDNEFKIIKSNGAVIEGGYSYIQYVTGKYFIIQKDGKFGIIDDEGNEVIKCKYDVIQPTLDYGIIQLLDKDGKNEILDKNMETIVQPAKINIVSTNGYLKVESKDDEIYINNEGKIVDVSEINSKSLYPETIKNYKIVDMGYGCPYYISQE